MDDTWLLEQVKRDVAAWRASADYTTWVDSIAWHVCFRCELCDPYKAFLAWLKKQDEPEEEAA